MQKLYFRGFGIISSFPSILRGCTILPPWNHHFFKLRDLRGISYPNFSSGENGVPEINYDSINGTMGQLQQIHTFGPINGVWQLIFMWKNGVNFGVWLVECPKSRNLR